MSDAVGSAIDRASYHGMLEAVGGDPAFMRELIDAFAADVPVQLETMRAAVTAGDTSVVTRGAHTLKSSAASLGALPLAERCGAFESKARTGDLGGAAAAIDEIERLASEAVAELRHLHPTA